MSWVGPVVKGAAKYGVKYGPQAKVAWDHGGKHVQAAARTKLDNVAARRTAFEQAETVTDGSVLKTIHQGKQIWVVFSADEPVAAYPTASPATPDLIELVSHADLSTRETPEQYRARQMRQRAKRARERMPKRSKRGEAPDSLE